MGQEYLAFLLLNLFDLFLTGYIFSHKGLEANGIAAFVLHHFGARWFCIYKFGLVIGVILICEIIANTSVPKARFIMLLGTFVYFGIVLYESWLIFENITKPMVHASVAPAILPLFNVMVKGLF